MFLNLRIKLQNFFRKNKNKIYIIAIIIALIIAVNIYLGRLKENAPPKVSYEPHTPIVSGKEITSKKTQESIENTIDDYMKKCNSKEYENAYALLSNDCKEVKFNNDIEMFKKYIDNIFIGEKIYSIQNYANKDNVYIYQVSIFEDIMATGKNTEQSDNIYKEMIVLTKDNEKMELSVDGFISKESIEYIAEDEYMKVAIEQKITYYDKVIYKMKVKNKTNYAILLARDNERETIGISLQGENRELVLEKYLSNEKCIRTGNTNTFDLTFNKYYDEKKEVSSITLNKIRIMEKYTGVESNWEEESNNIIKSYSATISID